MSDPSKGPPRRGAQLHSPPPPTDTDVSPRPFSHKVSTPVRDSPVRERVSFFEQVDRQKSVTPGSSRNAFETVEETRRRNFQETGHPRTPGTLFRESYESITEEGVDENGDKVVRVDRVILTKSVREVSRNSAHSSSSSIASPAKEQSPGPDEQDSAYRTRGMSKSSSISSLVSSWGTGRFTSQESLLGSAAADNSYSDRTTPSRTTDSSDYKHQPFQTIAARMKQIRSRAEYDSHIAEIKDEQERVQKKTFVNWINSYLSKRIPPMRVDDLIDDLKDGTRLLALLEVLSGERLPVEKGRNLKRPHFLSNANTALTFLTNKKIKLVNINATDLVDGRPPVVLGLIWTIILYFQIEENTRVLESLGHNYAGSLESLRGDASSPETFGHRKTPDKRNAGAKKAMLTWVQNAMPPSFNVVVKDFGPSWRDGNAFLGIIEAIKANLLDLASLNRGTNRDRLETAFHVAESELGIARLLDPEDVDVDRPDEKSIMTYVAQFLHKYPAPSAGASTLSEIQEEYSELVEWLMQKTQYLEHHVQTKTLSKNYSDFVTFKDNFKLKQVVFEKLKKLVDTQSMVAITLESWREIERLWAKLESQIRYWQWFLDSNLPGALGEVGKWLGDAENLIFNDDIPQLMNEETATIISRKLEEHKAFFAELPNVQSKFESALRSTLTQSVPQVQLDDIASRLDAVGPMAAERRVKLKFLEHKCCLIAFLHLTENKLRAWTVKYGYEDRVQVLLDQYKNFVSRNRIFQEFNKAYQDMQQVVEEYITEGKVDQKEKNNIDRFMRDTGERWKNVSMELRCVQSMLEEVINYWRKWNSGSVEFEAWVEQAYNVLRLSEVEKMEYFQELSVWKDKFQAISDAVQFLIATCDDPIAFDLRDKFNYLSTRWEELFPMVKQYMHAGDILRNRKEYQAGVDKLQAWLRNAESILASSQLGSTQNIKAYGEKLQQLQHEMESTEDLFKSVSKKFQELISELSREEVDRIMITLKKEKESLVRVRALIPTQLHLFHQILVQYESLETGQAEISQWLDEAESLLNSFSPVGDREFFQEQLEKHKAFFLRTFYYKSMLESKNKVHQSIIKSLHNTEGIDTSAFKSKMSQLNQRFTEVVQLSQSWEQRLNELLRCHERFAESETLVSNWLSQAEQMMGDKLLDNKQTVEAHKRFFEKVNEKWLHDFENAARDLKNCQPPEEKAVLEKHVEDLKQKWKDVLSNAPLHLMRLEFRLDESAFKTFLKDVEIELGNEQQALNKHDDIGKIINRHNDFFARQDVEGKAKQGLESLKKICTSYSSWKPNERDLFDSFLTVQNEWKAVNEKIEAFRQQLQEIPAQWQKYHSKFNELSKWMDSVDRSIESINREVNSLEEFENERRHFQEICHGVDARREDVKWLVQTLELLTSNCDDENSQQEHNNLEALVTRYKGLVPNIELTIVKTDVYSRCYNYRREVREVCNLLKKVKDTSSSSNFPDGLESAANLIKKQEAAIKQLDDQRANIMSMMHKGKDLAKDANAPAFIKDEVDSLGAAWNDAYSQTTEKLKALRSTQKIWNQYQEQKDEILKLIEQAEAELSRLTGGIDPRKIVADLQAKQEIGIALREATEDMLRKLRDICAALCKVTAPEKKPALQKEVADIEKRLHIVLESAQEQAIYLEQFQERWNWCKNQVRELKNWTQQAPSYLQHIAAPDCHPEEKQIRAQKLQAQFAENIDLLQNLAEEVNKLLKGDCDKEEAAILKDEVQDLERELAQLKRMFDNQLSTVNQDLALWNEYQNGLQQIKPWLEKAEMKIAVSSVKPETLPEAIQLLQAAKEFEAECEKKLGQLQAILTKSQTITCHTNASDEVDAVRSRWTSLHDQVTQRHAKLQKLVNTWQEFNALAHELCDWIGSKEREIAAIKEHRDNRGEKLEDDQAKLKAFANELSEKQFVLSALTQNADKICQNLSLDGAAALKNTLGEIKSRYAALGANLRDTSNAITDTILTRQEFDTTMATFNAWLDKQVPESQHIDNIPTEKVHSTLLSVHSMLQEVAEKQPALGTMHEEMKTIAKNASPNEIARLNDQFSKITKNFQAVEQNLQDKKSALEKWSELVNWNKESMEFINHTKFQIAQKSKPQELEALYVELGNIKNNLHPREKFAAEIDNAQFNLTVTDSASGKPIRAKQLVDEVKVACSDVHSQIDAKKETQHEIQNHWIQLQNMQQSLCQIILRLQGQIQDAVSDIPSTEKLEEALTALTRIQQDLFLTRPEKDALNNLGKKIMQEDHSNLLTVQNILTSIDSNWEKTNQTLNDYTAKYADIQQTWLQFEECNNKAVAAIQVGKNTITEVGEEPVDSTQLTIAQDKIKHALEHLARAKTSLDVMDAKGKFLVQEGAPLGLNVTSIKTAYAEALQGVHQTTEKINKITQNLAAQAMIWKHIEECKGIVQDWLRETCEGLTNAVQNPSNIELGVNQLNKYKDELGNNYNIKTSIVTKTGQLLKLTEGRPIPTLETLNKLLDEEFAHIKSIADNLDSLTSTIGEKEKEFKVDSKKISDDLEKLREALMSCDDLSGDNAKVLERLRKCKIVKNDLENLDGKVKDLRDKISDVTRSYSAFADSSAAKDLNALHKRFETVRSQADKTDGTLSTFLSKFNNEKFGTLQRAVGLIKEKLQWCTPEASSDKYNLEVKLSTLKDVEGAITECESKKNELENSFGMLMDVLSADKVAEFENEKSKLMREFAAVKNSYTETRDVLQHNIELWTQYEQVSEIVTSWLRDVEGRVRSESVNQVNLPELRENIRNNLHFKTEVENFKTTIDKLDSCGKEITARQPESRIGQYVQHLTSRYDAVVKFINGHIDRLQEIETNQANYNAAVQDVKNWIDDSKKKLDSFNSLPAVGPKTILTYQSKLKDLKSFLDGKEAGQTLLNTAVQRGDCLFSGITPDNREAIRTELRSLRDISEALIDDANAIGKRMEAIMIQRSSFDDSYNQVTQWIEEMRRKAGEENVELRATLQEKKALMHVFKSTAQDIDTHSNIFSQMEAKIEALSDNEARDKFDEILAEYKTLAERINRKIGTAEKYVDQHELLQQHFEKIQDWLTSCKAEAGVVTETAIEKEGADAKLMVVESLIQQKPEGDRLIGICQEQLQVVLQQTEISGHPALHNEFEEHRNAWENFLQHCLQIQAQLNQLCSKWSQFEATVDALLMWVKQKETQVRDQSLKNSLEAKQTQLDKLRLIEEEVWAKADQFTDLAEQSSGIEGETELTVKVSQLVTRYQGLKNAVKEAVGRYETFVQEHRSFNDQEAKFLDWIAMVEEQLKLLSVVVGDLAILQDRQRKIRDLVEVKNTESSKYESLIELGEKLYAHTSPDGREVIRQQLKTLRTLWDSFCEDLQASSNKLEQCLMQYVEFSMAQEQLTKWLRDIERAMQQHTELKASLQEKRAQLQNHKIMHQEIMSHQLLVESVCNTAQHLVDQTQDTSLNGYLDSIKQLFKNIVIKSQNLHDKLEKCIQEHNNYNSHCKVVHDWIVVEIEKQGECDTVSGEKSDIARRLSSVKSLRQNEEVGQRYLSELREMCNDVCANTASKGVEALEKEIIDLETMLKEHISSLDVIEAKLKSGLKQWHEFEVKLDEHTKWFRHTEAIFREQPLQESANKKEEVLSHIKDIRETILTKEKEIDEFTDASHSLLHSSGVERIKPLISQISNRYQLLHVLSKEVINNWQTLVDEHNSYDEKYASVDAWLGDLEGKYDNIKSKSNINEKAMLLQQLSLERDNANHRLSTLTALGERLFADTASQGREKIRQDLRVLRERWDKLEEQIADQQKKHEAETMQWSSYNEMLQQTLAWLDNMEKSLQNEPTAWSTSTQELRSKLLKQKAVLQDVLSHKRIIETVCDKAKALSQSSNFGNSETLKAGQQINDRYEKLVNNFLMNIAALEESLDAFTVFHDLQKSHQDYQKQLWERSSALADYSGNKSALQSRLAKVVDIENSLTEGTTTLKLLAEHIERNQSKLPPRAKEAMERDLSTLKFEFDKFVTSLSDMKHGLEERIQQWSEYELSFERLLAWLSETEAALKNYAHKSTLEEKEEQLEKYKTMLLTLKQNELEFDKMSDDATELAHVTGESRISVNIQQITSRFQGIQSTAKEILKKCEQAASDHQAYLEKYKQASTWLANAQNKYYRSIDAKSLSTKNDVEKQLASLRELLGEQGASMQLINTTVELGEKLYPFTAVEGREAIRLQLEELQQALETLFDEVSGTEKKLQEKLSRWTNFEELSDHMKKWLKDVEPQLPEEIVLWTTLDEKRAQLQSYRLAHNDVINHQQDFGLLKDRAEGLPERSAKIDQLLNQLVRQYDTLYKRAQTYVESYEAIVSDHQQYSKAVMETQEWLEATNSTMMLWGDSDLERISLHSNIERLKNLLLSLPEEEYRIHAIRNLGEKVVPSTVESGQVNIRSQILASQQEWEGLISTAKSTIESLESKLGQWNEYEKMKDECLAWIRLTDSKLHSVDLKANLQEKIDQLEALKCLQAEVRAKELEMDAVTERAQQLYKGSLSARSSQISELGLKYQQVSHKAKDLTSRWHGYVTSHQNFDSNNSECLKWLEEVKRKLDYCSDSSTKSQKDLEQKLEIIQGLILCKEEGFAKVQCTVELAQNVLANTATSGHAQINQAVNKLQEEWSSLASRMIDTKNQLDDSIHRWSGFLEQIAQLDKVLDPIETSFNELSEFQTTMSEKRAQLERLRTLEEKVRCEKIEVDGHRAKAQEMMASGQQSQAALKAQTTLQRFDSMAEKVKKLLAEREDQYRDHRLYKEAHDDLIGWLSRAREKVPCIKQQSLSDKLAIENAVAPLESLLNKQAQGELLVEHLTHTGEVAIASTSKQGQDQIRNEIRALREGFESLFRDIRQQKHQLESTVGQWRDYKEEYERLSDWLQQIEIHIKAQKTALLSNVQEKRKQVNEVTELLQKLEKGQEQIDRFNQAYGSLMASHLDTYIQTQMKHLNSRYQVLVNMAKDVMKKVETNLDQHEQYETNHAKAQKWIENAKQIIWDSSSGASSSSREVLQSRLNQVQDLMKQREMAQNLVHSTVGWGEKTLRNTRSDGRDAINNQLRDLQADWDRLVKKLSTTKVNLETSLLQWADYNSSYTNLQQWISEREAKLQQVCEQRLPKTRKTVTTSGMSSLSMGERKATLRQTNSIVQDIVSFEPMIQSVASKASDLQQPAAEIASKYETLTKQAKELYAKQKETVEQHQAFIDSGNDFVQWIRAAKERLSKCSEPTGDKDSLSSKVSQLKVLQSEQPEGQKKLEKALEQGEVAYQVADKEDKEVIEEEVALLQEEFDNYVDSLTHTKFLLEEGIVKWTEYEDQYQEATDWLSQTEGHVQGFNKLFNTLEEKKTILEQFQMHLQTVFDWQKELDRLNMKAQSLLETCADSRISNAVTQMTTKYNALLSLAKEVMRRLELHYQEHQQHYTLYQELEDWIDRTKEKVKECQESPTSLSDANNKLQMVKTIRQSLEQGQNKLRYAIELKEKVILNTEQVGAAKIQEDTENLKAEFEKLMAIVQDLRTKLTAKISQLEDSNKDLKMLNEWIEEVEQKMQQIESSVQTGDFSEKRAALEKVRIINKDVASHDEMIDRAKAKLQENNTQPTTEFEASLSKFEDLKEKIKKNITDLEDIVNKHDLYRRSYNDAFDWMRKKRIDVQHCNDTHGEKEKILEKDTVMKGVSAIMPEGEALVQKAVELYNDLKSSVTGQEGQDMLNQEISALKSDLESLKGMFKDTQKVITKCITAWDDFHSSYDSMKSWLDDFQTRIHVDNEDEKVTPEDLQKCHALLKEANQHKMQMEELNDRCELLVELSACERIRDQTVHLQGTYTNIVTLLQGLVSKVQKNLSDHTEFINAKEEFDVWLKRAQGTVQSCEGVGDEAATKDKLETIRLVANRMTEGQHMMSAVQVIFSKAISNTPEEQQEILRETMGYLQKSWEQLSMDLNNVMSNLKSYTNRWEDFNDSKSRFIVWIGEMEENLREVPETKAELGEMKKLIERYKHLQDEVKRRRTELDHLLTEATELSTWAGNQLLLDEMKNVQSRYDHLFIKCNARMTSLQDEMQDYSQYHQSLQEAEKWLLQISFQLMAHNSLYITNRTQTQDQITDHENLLSEIQRYQAVLDDVKSKGYTQIERYVVSVPSLQAAIEKQLQNVQDSYNSLLNTAIQIKNRLLESLSKFQEYEDTVESIMRNLDVLEPQITTEVDTHAASLADSQHQVERVRSLHNKLQTEKSRLAIAVQACEAAAACISRPSSPQDVTPTPIPDRELEVRAKMEDLIDQVQNKLSSLNSAVGELEEWSRQQGLMKIWAQEQRAFVTEWNARPSKLRSEAARQEFAQAEDLLQNVDVRRRQLAELKTEPDEALQNELSQLELDVHNLIAKKQASQNVIEDYRSAVQEAQTWMDQVCKSMEVLDKGSGLLCYQKLSSVGDILRDFDANKYKLDELKAKGSAVIDQVSNLETQQVEEQLKAIERRHGDIGKKIQRKAQILEMTKTGYDTAIEEIELARKWAKEKVKGVEKQTPLGFESKSVEEKLQDLKSLLKEAEGKEILLETLEKRVGSMQAELEPSEHSLLEGNLRSLALDHDELCALLRREMTKLAAAIEQRRKFEADVDKALAWIKTKDNEIKPGGWTPLNTACIEKDLQTYKNLETAVKNYNGTTLADIQRQSNNLAKECDDENKAKLQEIMDDLSERYIILTKKLAAKIECLGELNVGRKEFETDLENCWHWLKQAAVSVSADIHTTNIDLMQDHLEKYVKLEGEAVENGKLVERVFTLGSSILPSVSEADRVSLTEQLSSLKKEHYSMSAIIRERLESLKKAIGASQQAAEQLQETINFMTTIRQEIMELNKPIGSKVEDVQGVLSSYEKILGDLKQYKQKLGELDPSKTTDLKAVLKQQDDLIKTIEDQISRLKQLLLLRQQFISIITEILTFITKYTGIVRDIEKGGQTVEEKIKKYDDVILKIQECEAMLATATDKGQAIANEGTAADRNNVTEQLQSLKQQLQGLRRAVESQRSQHVLTAEAHKKLAVELGAALDGLHKNEAAVRSRPLLERAVASVENEIVKHKALSAEVEKQLDVIRKVRGDVQHDEGLPSALADQLSEATMLLNSLPQELTDRSKYLESNKSYRTEHQLLKEKLNLWIENASKIMDVGHEGVDFVDIFTHLENHKKFFSNEPMVKELVTQIQQSGDRIWPSLCTSEQEELSAEHQLATQSLKNTLNLARSRKAQLDQDSELWKEYLKLKERVQHISGRNRFVDDSVSSLPSLHSNIQRITYALNDIQGQSHEIDLLLERAKEISNKADAENKLTIDSDMSAISTEWNGLISELENRKETLTKLAEHWETFESKWQQIDSKLLGIEVKLKHEDLVVRNKAQLKETQGKVENMSQEANCLRPMYDELQTLSRTVHTFLSANSEPAAQDFKQKLDSLWERIAKLLDALRDTESDLIKKKELLKQQEEKGKNLLQVLREILSSIHEFYIFDEDQSKVESQLQELEREVEQQLGKSNSLNSDIKEHYTQTQEYLPSDLAHELSALEILSENVKATMEEKQREFKRAKTIRSDYLRDVEEVQNWILEAEKKVQDQSVEPHILKEYLQQIQSEYASANEKLERLTKNGHFICEKSRDVSEQDLIRSTITNLTEQLLQVKSWLEERKMQVGDSIDSWRKFMQLYEHIKNWSTEKTAFLAQPLHLATLVEARQKVNDYALAVKSCKHIGKNLGEMAKELEIIASTSNNTSDLQEKYDEVDELKTEVEGNLIETSALLQDTAEEWEQCEKKLKDVHAWIEKSRNALDSPQNKKKALKDQLAMREKMTNDITIQKTKISISVEKLQVHFRGGVGGDAKVSEQAAEIIQELGQLLAVVKEQAATLEKCLDQIEKYQQEIQQLRQQIINVEQQLRVVMAPTYLPHNREKALEEQNAFRERIKALQIKITARNGRINLLIQRGTPDLEPLDS
ncbi:muscle-specific protein 300 kDa isoform X2 [Neocloeon triangulifer]|uniref:muscle-specific protein 300 kDa isoform X2 n=1 Tax=Neocloeon triangulifer TaxID=2078957 RepID=UPI00286F9218|nr:muscle-specific protein 300 kDa isoform X2 [Neocloeon triangulifer]